MNRLSLSILSTTLLLVTTLSVVWATSSVKQDNQHVRVWNQFVEDTLALHKKITANKNLTVKKRVGGYATNKDFYTESQYFENGHLISQIQWEKENSKQIHSIEVYLRDDNGRVLRDFMGAYLPHYRNAPTQTLISFHQYNGQLHAFRSFDASGEMVLERCTGKNSKGQKVSFLLDENDLFNDDEGVMETADYQACFKGLKQNELGKYVIPQ